MPALVFGPFVLDPQGASLRRDGAEIPVQPKVLDLLAALASRPGELLSREALTEIVWPGVHVSPNVLDQALRKARAALGDDPGAPRFIEVVPRRGWRFVAEVRERAVAPGLVGRDGALDRLSAALARPGLVWVWGAPGVGKTRLLEAALPPDAVRVALSDEDRTLDDVARRIQGVLGLPVAGGAVDERVAAALAGRDRAVVALDGGDELGEDAVRGLARWVAGAPGLVLAVTTRRRPPIPEADEFELGPLGPGDALELLQARVPPEVGQLDAEDTRTLLVHLDGLPLAIELAAARLRVVSPGALAARLADSIRALAPLEAALQQAWDALDGDDRRVLAAASAPGRPFAADEIEALVPEVADPWLALRRLADASLVVGGPGALAVLHTVGAFVRSRTPAAELAALRARWAAAVHDRVAAWIGPALRMEGPALTALFERREDLARVVAHLDAAPVAVWPGLAAAAALAARYVGPWGPARAVLERVARDAPLDAVVQVLLGEYRLRTGDVAGALEAVERAAAAGDPAVAAQAGMLAARVTGDGARARAAQAHARAARAPGLVALALDAEGAARARAGDRAGAEACYAEAVTWASAPGLAGVRGTVLQNHAAHGHDAPEVAVRLFAAAAADLDGVPFPHLPASARFNLGVAALQAGRDAEAVDGLLACAEVVRRIGDRSLERKAVTWGWSAALVADRPDAGLRCAARLEALADTPATQADLATLRALSAWAWGPGAASGADPEGALGLAAVLARRDGAPGVLAEVLAFSAAFDRAAGRPDGALLAEARAVGGPDHPLLAVLDGAEPRTAHARLVARLLARDRPFSD